MKSEKFGKSEEAMTQFIEKRPTAVSVIGWFWIIAGGFLALAAGTSLLHRPNESVVNDAAKQHAFLGMAARCYAVSGVLLLTTGATAIVSGIAFLRLRKWGRTALEVISWLAVAYITVAVVGMIAMMSFYLSGVSVLFGILLAGISGAFYWVPLGFIIRSLRSKKVRDAVASPPRVTP
ncbi:MAG: hypothetical protein HZC54_21435 [Verrucomicrobia bacterium]|nr:hypothetical protein [Verrucomicrobiota bacterium]